MSFRVAWGRTGERGVVGVEDLDRVLDEIGAAGRPQVVSIYPPGYVEESESSPWDEPPRDVLEIGIGHPDRGFVVWLGEQGGLGAEREVPPWPAASHDIAFDYGGDPVFCGPERASVTPGKARQAAREFIASGGRRPTCVDWV